MTIEKYIRIRRIETNFAIYFSMITGNSRFMEWLTMEWEKISPISLVLFFRYFISSRSLLLIKEIIKRIEADYFRMIMKQMQVDEVQTVFFVINFFDHIYYFFFSIHQQKRRKSIQPHIEKYCINEIAFSCYGHDDDFVFSMLCLWSCCCLGSIFCWSRIGLWSCLWGTWRLSCAPSFLIEWNTWPM